MGDFRHDKGGRGWLRWLACRSGLMFVLGFSTAGFHASLARAAEAVELKTAQANGGVSDYWIQRARSNLTSFLAAQDKDSIRPEYGGFLKPEGISQPVVVEGQDELPELAEGKVLSVGADGRVIAVDAKDEAAISRRARVAAADGQWEVRAEADEEPVLDEDGMAAPEDGATNTPTFDVAPEQVPTEFREARPARDVPPPSRIVERYSLEGQVEVPDGISPSTVVVRVAGTSIEAQVGADGTFEIPDLPAGSKIELLVWDTRALLTRRLIPVSVARDLPPLTVPLERASVTDSVALSFGHEQSMLAAGFCGEVDAGVPAARMGGRVTVWGGKGFYPVRYFSENGLPDARVGELTSDGRFCVFNISDRLVRVRIQLPNGVLRESVLHLEPTVFEPTLAFDVQTSVFRRPRPLELVDGAAVEQGSVAPYSTLGEAAWAVGEDLSTWQPAYGLWLSGAAAYGSVAIEESAGAQLFGASDEFVEVSWGDSDDDRRGMTLVGRDQLFSRALREGIASGRMRMNALADWNSVLALPVISRDSVGRLANELGLDLDEGLAVVVLDLDSLGMDFRDLRVSVRHPWTGQRAGQVRFVRPAAGARQVQVVVAGLPVGEHSLVVTDADGAVRWLDVIRTERGRFQVVLAGHGPHGAGMR